MNDLNRYSVVGHGGHQEYPNGEWCKWEDAQKRIEKLEKDLSDMTAKAFAAVWLLDGDTVLDSLQELYRNAKELFMGKDKETISKLQDALSNAQEHIRHIQRPPTPGVSSVCGTSTKDGIVYVLPIHRIDRNPDGGLNIGVYLP